MVEQPQAINSLVVLAALLLAPGLSGVLLYADEDVEPPRWARSRTWPWLWSQQDPFLLFWL